MRVQGPRRRSGLSVAATVAGAAIAIPLVLAATPLDYFKDRNLIAADPSVDRLRLRDRTREAKTPRRRGASGRGHRGGWRRGGGRAKPQLQRTDWRGASRALGHPVLARAVVIRPPQAEIALSYYGQRLVPMPIGAKVKEIDILGEGVDPREAAPPAFVATLRRSLPGLAVLRFQAAKPVMITETVINLAGGSMLLELGRAGAHWIAEYFAALAAWKQALSEIARGPEPRAVLAAAPDVVNTLTLLPPEIPSAGQLLTRLRQIVQLAAKVAAQPDAGNEAALRGALTGTTG